MALQSVHHAHTQWCQHQHTKVTIAAVLESLTHMQQYMHMGIVNTQTSGRECSDMHNSQSLPTALLCFHAPRQAPDIDCAMVRRWLCSLQPFVPCYSFTCCYSHAYNPSAAIIKQAHSNSVVIVMLNRCCKCCTRNTLKVKCTKQPCTPKQ